MSSHTMPAMGFKSTDECLKQVNKDMQQFKAGFNRLRALLAQEKEQSQRPVARVYSGSRAVKA